MAGPIDELLNRDFPVPHSDPDTLPAFLELSSGAFVPIEGASKAQVRLTAKMHREIACRHALLADRLDAFVAKTDA